MSRTQVTIQPGSTLVQVIRGMNEGYERLDELLERLGARPH